MKKCILVYPLLVFFSLLCTTHDIRAETLPVYDGKPYVEVNGNNPYFTNKDYAAASFETYSELDSLGRCGTAIANIGKDIMPTQPRGGIGMVKPSGWNQAKYEGIVDSNPPYLYNRCHLIGYQLSGENANERNLITGTRYLNTDGMLPFENKVADHIDRYGGHVLYRVTPCFEGDNLLASGVMIEAASTEDKGKTLSFCVYCFNVEPGVDINYSDGSSMLSAAVDIGETAIAQKEIGKNKAPPQYSKETKTSSSVSYIANRNTKKFHYAGCGSVSDMKEKNKVPYNTREEAVNDGYVPCKRCNP